MKQHDVLALLREMPDDIDTDDLLYRLYLRQKLEAAAAAAETGDLIPHDRVHAFSYSLPTWKQTNDDTATAL